MSSKTPWRMLWRYIRDCPIVVHLETGNLLPTTLMFTPHHSWRPKSPNIHSGLLGDLENTLQTQKEIEIVTTPTQPQLNSKVGCENDFRPPTTKAAQNQSIIH